jgi:hypothetical protein
MSFAASAEPAREGGRYSQIGEVDGPPRVM